jgi:murein DD-endopeptidase MepM/ murein hydrolase activator NlpD
VWDAQPVTANARSVDGGRYIVQPGDTLRSIGAKTGAGSETLARVNNLSAPFILHPGDVLTIPAGRFHGVAAGETGIAIARAYEVPWGNIVAANALEEPFTLRVGQRLIIPGEIRPPDIVPPSEQTLEARAAAFKLDIEDIISGGEPAVATSAAVPPVAEPARFAGTFAWPAAGSIASSFGPKSEGTVNQGIELAVAPAAPILASADGVVAFVGNNVAPVGGLILIRHGGGWITAYGHAASAGVLRGQTVKRGQALGKAGTGSAPLLFFQMRKNGVPVDPVKNLPVR